MKLSAEHQRWVNQGDDFVVDFFFDYPDHEFCGPLVCYSLCTKLRDATMTREQWNTNGLFRTFCMVTRNTTLHSLEETLIYCLLIGVNN